MREPAPASLAALEMDLLVDAVSRAYDVDVRRLPRAMVEAAVAGLVHRSGVRSVAALVDRILHEPGFGRAAVNALCACDTGLFDDATFHKAFVEHVIPWLRTYPYSSVWVAECGTGGSVYSIAIMLHEAGLYERTCIHATDHDRLLLSHAREGIVPLAAVEYGDANYRAAGGLRGLVDHFAIDGDTAVLSDALLRNIVWSHYDLNEGHSFNEFNLIVCGAFGAPQPSTQRRVVRLLTDSLSVSGLLAFGASGQLDLSSVASCYKRWHAGAHLYQRTC